MGRLLTIGVGVFATVLGLLFVSLSFATDHWIEYVVQRDDSDFIKAVIDDGKNASYVSNPIYFNRNRGLLRTCYPGTESACKYNNPAKNITYLCQKGEIVSNKEHNMVPTWLAQHNLFDHANAIYNFVVVSFDAVAQAMDIKIERRQFVFL